VLCEKSKSLNFSGGVANVLGRRGDFPASKYLFEEPRRPTSRGLGGGGPPPCTCYKKQNATGAKTKAADTKPTATAATPCRGGVSG